MDIEIPENDGPLDHRSRGGITDRTAAEKILRQRRQQLISDFAAVASTNEGRRVFRYLKDFCGFHKTQVGGNPGLGMDVLHGTFYNSVRHGVYTEIRSLIPAAHLAVIEFQESEQIE